ncbi:hypothetical protein DBR11_19185 [Pedobacter sp. HMWF019]|uniref:FecR family protein n=1 Tax=Pedobacter sp. HMWF019 TaxID=2056856 RepID=UPI000D3D956A|nr:FecR family protein [Pedobacter sp. HMWF019]PTS96403.1 hypothetical protein DBR11_19185 [Pedobacter sp. HMWF019]
MIKKDAKELLKKYSFGTCNPEEKAWLETWYLDWKKEDELNLSEEAFEAAEKIMWANLNGRMLKEAKVPVIQRLIYIAAAVFILVSAAVLFFHNPAKTDISIKTGYTINDIDPGTDKAILTLANGKQLTLEGTKKGLLAKEGNSKIFKTADGHIAYNSGKASAALAVLNKLETPKGGQFMLMLPDGTRVWLNSASTLIYPTAFIGKERKVKLIGEAYFEVAKNKKKPFMVTSGTQIIEVLGTHFNINSYPDEQSIKTSLLEGSVKVTNGNSLVQKVLKPGEESVMQKSDGAIAVNQADVEDAVAWQQGYFLLKNEDLQMIMRRISRWYDVRVVYKGSIPVKQFGGMISRSKKISEILKLLESTGSVHFKVEGKEVTVLN